MDFKKLRECVDAKVYLDLDTATQDNLRVNYDQMEDDSWFVIIPSKYKREEDLAAIINAKAQIKLQSKDSAPFRSKR